MPNARHVPLATLPTFRAVAKAANLRAAAERLHLTHSAVSQQLKLLESQLGFELFDRRGRRLVLNAAGEALLRAVEPALDRIGEGVVAAEAMARGEMQRVRITTLPSFAQRWLLPRMGRLRDRHPDLALEIHTTRNVVDLQRDGIHVAIRQGQGQWRGLHAEPLLQAPLVAVAAPARGARLAALPADERLEAMAAEPLLGPQELWQRWLTQGGFRGVVRPVAEFADAGLMLQAVEQDIGIGLTRDLLAADALRDGQLVRVAEVTIDDEDAYGAYWWVCLPELRDWPPLVALRAWVFEEIAISRRALKRRGRAV